MWPKMPLKGNPRFKSSSTSRFHLFFFFFFFFSFELLLCWSGYGSWKVKFFTFLFCFNRQMLIVVYLVFFLAETIDRTRDLFLLPFFINHATNLISLCCWCCCSVDRDRREGASHGAVEGKACWLRLEGWNENSLQVIFLFLFFSSLFINLERICEELLGF